MRGQVETVKNPEAPCGRDALGAVLKDGDPMICLCCGSGGHAHPKKDALDGFDYEGSSWVQQAVFKERCKALPMARPDDVRRIMRNEIYPGAKHGDER